MTNAELALATGASKNTITNAERGNSNPSPMLLKNWATATGVSHNWLITGKTPAESEQESLFSGES